MKLYTVSVYIIHQNMHANSEASVLNIEKQTEN